MRGCASYRCRPTNQGNAYWAGRMDRFVVRPTVPTVSASSKRLTSHALGSGVAGAASIAALRVIANPTPPVRLGLTLILPVVAVMAFVGSWQDGACPKCRARARTQERTDLPPEVEPASQAVAVKGEVDIELGWQVTLAQNISCLACGHRYSAADDIFVTRFEARTPSEAVVLAQSKARQA